MAHQPYRLANSGEGFQNPTKLADCLMDGPNPQLYVVSLFCICSYQLIPWCLAASEAMSSNWMVLSLAEAAVAVAAAAAAAADTSSSTRVSAEACDCESVSSSLSVVIALLGAAVDGGASSAPTRAAVTADIEAKPLPAGESALVAPWDS